MYQETVLYQSEDIWKYSPIIKDEYENFIKIKENIIPKLYTIAIESFLFIKIISIYNDSMKNR